MAEIDKRVERELEQFAELYGEECAEVFLGRCSDAALSSSSPIEQLMAAALYYAINSTSWYGSLGTDANTFFFGVPVPPELLSCTPDAEGIEIYQQVPVGRYRADFLVTFAHFNGGFARAGIECDGHDFHDRTKDQAQHDRKRDRAFQAAGLLILRYTGAEIWRSPLKCAVDALGILERRSTDDDALRWKPRQ